MKVRDVMSKNVVSISHSTPFRDVWKVIFSSRVNAVPVVDQKKRLLGIITKDDVLTSLYPDYKDVVEDFLSITDFEDMENRISTLGNKKVKEIMCTRVIHTREDTPIMRALSRMIVRQVSQLPVITEANVVVGIITKGDIFKSIITRQMVQDAKEHPKSPKSITQKYTQK